MNYDFRADARELRTLLGDAVDIYLLARGRSPAEHPDVTRVELAFLVGVPQPPSVYVDFDTRPDAEPDGDATHRCIAQLQRPKWTSFLLPPKGEKVFRATARAVSCSPASCPAAKRYYPVPTAPRPAAG